MAFNLLKHVTGLLEVFQPPGHQKSIVVRHMLVTKCEPKSVDASNQESGNFEIRIKYHIPIIHENEFPM